MALASTGSVRALTTNIDILAGRSNMVGRGILTSENRIDMSRILNWDEKCLHEAVEQLFHDRPTGVSPDAQFARTLADRDPDVVIGLIPAAVGGTSLQNRIGFLANNAIVLRNDALKGGGKLKGVIWYQGSFGCFPKLPFVVGELGAHLENFKVNGRLAGGDWREVNCQLALLVNNLPYTRLVSSKGVMPNSDAFHLDTPSTWLNAALSLLTERNARITTPVEKKAEGARPTRGPPRLAMTAGGSSGSERPCARFISRPDSSIP